jgi:hypothetical protein
MARPYFLTINKVTCFSTEDYTGNDELAGAIGPVTFEIGTFNAGDSREINVTQIVPENEFWLTVIERDLVDSNDVLGQVDLSIDMDVPRSVLIEKGTARYELNLTVNSVSD